MILKKRRKLNVDPAFKTVLFSPHLIEYKGVLPALRGVRHHFYCSEVSAEQSAALSGGGFRSIAGDRPTHIFLCTFALNRDAGGSRTLFALTLDLSSFTRGKAAYVAVVVARGLRRTLAERRSPDFLIRCRTSHEFPFCLDDSLIDQFWIDWALAYYRRGLRDLDE